MIRKVSDLFDGLRKKETAALALWKLDHAPMTGNMYEGLTRHLLAVRIWAWN